MPSTTRSQRSEFKGEHHGYSYVEHRLARVNEELDATDLAEVLKKRHRNSVGPASVLPPELLSSVFSINVLCDRPGSPKNGLGKYYSLGWISATQVCHRWREVRHTSVHLPLQFLTVGYFRSHLQRRLSGDMWISQECRESGAQRC